MSTVMPARVVKRPRRRKSLTDQSRAGWLFTAPMLLILGIFLAVPVIMAAWVSVSDWGGRGSPFSADVNYVGLQHYRDLIFGSGLASRDLGIALRNNVWYVLLVVPIQTALSLGLALLVNQRILKGKGIFRTAFYFPSVTSSVAITVVWLFLFNTSGAINKVLSWIGVSGPNWFQDPSGVVHNILGVIGINRAPAALGDRSLLGLSLWDWIAGPSVAMSALILMAIFTTSGTFMLLFIAALQNISEEVDEAARIDGANTWQRFWQVTLPQLKPTVFTVITLGLIGTWQVFDAIYTGTQGAPGKTTVTPAYLSYSSAFISQQWGRGAAIAFILFFIIVLMTIIQRMLLRERDTPSRTFRQKKKPPPTPQPLPIEGGK